MGNSFHSSCYPKIIQGGMGVRISGWQLAKAVSSTGQLGVVSGVALDAVLARSLQLGDLSTDIRRALDAFPIPGMADKVIKKYYISGGKKPNQPFAPTPIWTLDSSPESLELNVLGNFVEVFLAKEGHHNPVGINYMEKIQLPTPSSLYGALLAGVDVVIVGAGIPVYFPELIERLRQHDGVAIPIYMPGKSKEETGYYAFSPRKFLKDIKIDLALPAFLPVVSSHTLAEILHRKIGDKIDGFILEDHTAGGHNAHPRGRLQTTPQGEPIYGDRDQIQLETIKNLGKPFWLAGGYGSKQRLLQALEEGATGVQVGTAFAFCQESGLIANLKQEILQQILFKKVHTYTDIHLSPTGFPFKVVKLDDSLSEETIRREREPICDLGYLRHAYWNQNGTMGFRCPAEPMDKFLSKGGTVEAAIGRVCLCNALMANVGLEQIRPDGYREKHLVTAGHALTGLVHILEKYGVHYSASDVVREILQTASNGA
ncbi:MAG: nitronate monooxygenase [Magnetococcales bacterium]|nr:nitronate monooxygenase [Magnetococcales bacterium]